MAKKKTGKTEDVGKDIPVNNIPLPEMMTKDPTAGKFQTPAPPVNNIKVPQERPTGEIEKAKRALMDQGLTEKQAGAIAIPQVIEMQNAQQAQMQMSIQNMQSAGNLGKQVSPTATLPGGDAGLTAALNIPAIAGGIATGAGIGALGGPVGIAVGGVVGGITAFLGKLTADQRQATKEAYKVYSTSSTRMNELMNLANSGQVSSGEIALAYNQHLANMRLARDSLRQKVKGKVGAQLSGAQDELIAVESWLEAEPFFRAEMQAAILSPNPSKIIPIQENLNTDGSLN